MANAWSCIHLGHASADFKSLTSGFGFGFVYLISHSLALAPALIPTPAARFRFALLHLFEQGHSLPTGPHAQAPFDVLNAFQAKSAALAGLLASSFPPPRVMTSPRLGIPVPRASRAKPPYAGFVRT